MTELFVKPYAEADEQFTAPKNIECINEYHVACVLLIDTSGSLSGSPIEQLNRGLQKFKDQTVNTKMMDDEVKKTIDVAIITFGREVTLIQDFVPITDITMPVLQADGYTPLGEGLNLAMDVITNRKKVYSDFGTPYYRPWIFCITDGEPTDDYREAAGRLKDMQERNGVVGYCVGVDNFNERTMAKIFSPHRIFTLEGHDFVAMFEFLSNSLSCVRNSDPTAGRTASVELPPTMHTTTIEF